jgi:hypothetical protein
MRWLRRSERRHPTRVLYILHCCGGGGVYAQKGALKQDVDAQAITQQCLRVCLRMPAVPTHPLAAVTLAALVVCKVKLQLPLQVLPTTNGPAAEATGSALPPARLSPQPLLLPPPIPCKSCSFGATLEVAVGAGVEAADAPKVWDPNTVLCSRWGHT